MRLKLTKWLFRLTFTTLFIIGVLVVILLNPVLTYANKTTFEHCTIYHNKLLDTLFAYRLKEAGLLIENSECYRANLQLDICLNDEAVYPSIVKAIRGDAFAWGFYKEVVLQGTIDAHENMVEYNGYQWNLSQLLAHEMVHCMQFDKLGLFKSNPIANIPEWKWEGYAEYISRQNADQRNLTENIQRIEKAAADNPNSWEVLFSDGTIAPKQYYAYWLLVQYSFQVKQMTYLEILKDTTAQSVIHQQMMNWYDQKK